MNMEISPEALEFLWFLLFGMRYEYAKNNIEKTLLKCARLAYRDFCRTLKYKTDSIAERKEFVGEICASLVSKITDELFKCSSEEEFDKKHKEICEWVITEFNEKDILREPFCYGQAQKWLNMTLKNMIVTGFWDKDENFKRIKNWMHVPVDSNIITKAKIDFQITPENKTWSRWEYDLYIDFQNRIRDGIKKNKKYKNPIDWEFDKWYK
ncbi:MAG: hypothetical protein BWY46_00266 [Firmicutes bacterium ADurb.Bin300]|nr:MAG: hypothetical protein BWY46_00266 [Firmicutes bacterium ADurb.Bin300]